MRKLKHIILPLTATLSVSAFLVAPSAVRPPDEDLPQTDPTEDERSDFSRSVQDYKNTAIADIFSWNYYQDYALNDMKGNDFIVYAKDWENKKKQFLDQFTKEFEKIKTKTINKTITYNDVNNYLTFKKQQSLEGWFDWRSLFRTYPITGKYPEVKNFGSSKTSTLTGFDLNKILPASMFKNPPIPILIHSINTDHSNTNTYYSKIYYTQITAINTYLTSSSGGFWSQQNFELKESVLSPQELNDKIKTVSKNILDPVSWNQYVNSKSNFLHSNSTNITEFRNKLSNLEIYINNKIQNFRQNVGSNNVKPLNVKISPYIDLNKIKIKIDFVNAITGDYFANYRENISIDFQPQVIAESTASVKDRLSLQPGSVPKILLGIDNTYDPVKDIPATITDEKTLEKLKKLPGIYQGKFLYHSPIKIKFYTTNKENEILVVDGKKIDVLDYEFTFELTEIQENLKKGISSSHNIQILEKDAKGDFKNLVYEMDIELQSLSTDFAVKYYAWDPEHVPWQKALISPYLLDSQGQPIFSKDSKGREQKIPNPIYNKDIDITTGITKELVWIKATDLPTNALINWFGNGSGLNGFLAEAYVVPKAINFLIKDEYTSSYIIDFSSIKHGYKPRTDTLNISDSYWKLLENLKHGQYTATEYLKKHLAWNPASGFNDFLLVLQDYFKQISTPQQVFEIVKNNDSSKLFALKHNNQITSQSMSLINDIINQIWNQTVLTQKYQITFLDNKLVLYQLKANETPKPLEYANDITAFSHPLKRSKIIPVNFNPNKVIPNIKTIKETDYYSVSGDWLIYVNKPKTPSAFKLVKIKPLPTNPNDFKYYKYTQLDDANKNVINFWSSSYGKALHNWLLVEYKTNEKDIKSLSYSQVANYWNLFLLNTAFNKKKVNFYLDINKLQTIFNKYPNTKQFINYIKQNWKTLSITKKVSNETLKYFDRLNISAVESGQTTTLKFKFIESVETGAEIFQKFITIQPEQFTLELPKNYVFLKFDKQKIITRMQELAITKWSSFREIFKKEWKTFLNINETRHSLPNALDYVELIKINSLYNVATKSNFIELEFKPIKNQQFITLIEPPKVIFNMAELGIINDKPDKLVIGASFDVKLLNYHAKTMSKNQFLTWFKTNWNSLIVKKSFDLNNTTYLFKDFFTINPKIYFDNYQFEWMLDISETTINVNDDYFKNLSIRHEPSNKISINFLGATTPFDPFIALTENWTLNLKGETSLATAKEIIIKKIQAIFLDNWPQHKIQYLKDYTIDFSQLENKSDNTGTLQTDFDIAIKISTIGNIIFTPNSTKYMNITNTIGEQAIAKITDLSKVVIDNIKINTLNIEQAVFQVITELNKQLISNNLIIKNIDFYNKIAKLTTNEINANKTQANLEIATFAETYLNLTKFNRNEFTIIPLNNMLKGKIKFIVINDAIKIFDLSNFEMKIILTDELIDKENTFPKLETYIKNQVLTELNQKSTFKFNENEFKIQPYLELLKSSSKTFYVEVLPNNTKKLINKGALKIINNISPEKLKYLIDNTQREKEKELKNKQQREITTWSIAIASVILLVSVSLIWWVRRRKNKIK